MFHFAQFVRETFDLFFAMFQSKPHAALAPSV
jgi:hypothetical protein